MAANVLSVVLKIAIGSKEGENGFINHFLRPNRYKKGIRISSFQPLYSDTQKMGLLFLLVPFRNSVGL